MTKTELVRRDNVADQEIEDELSWQEQRDRPEREDEVEDDRL